MTHDNTVTAATTPELPHVHSWFSSWADQPLAEQWTSTMPDRHDTPGSEPTHSPARDPQVRAEKALGVRVHRARQPPACSHTALALAEFCTAPSPLSGSKTPTTDSRPPHVGACCPAPLTLSGVQRQPAECSVTCAQCTPCLPAKPLKLCTLGPALHRASLQAGH